MTREHRQAEMEAFGAAVLAEDYGAVPEGWGLQQMCGAGFGAAALPEGWFKVKTGVYRKKEPSGEDGDYDSAWNPNVFTVKLSPKTKHRGKGWRVHEKGAKGSHTYWTAHPTATKAMTSVEERFYPPRKSKKSKPKTKKPWWRFGFGALLWKKHWKNYWISTIFVADEDVPERRYETMVFPIHSGVPDFREVDGAYAETKGQALRNHERLAAKWKGKHARKRQQGGLGVLRPDSVGQGPWPGVDVSLQSGIQGYGSLWSEAATDVAQGKVTEADIEDATPDAEEAIVALQSAVNALWGASGQLERTQRGRARGGRYRHRRLVQDMELLLTSFFQGAADTEGQPIGWEDVVTELPATSIGPEVFNFGAKLPTYIPVESEVGIIRVSIPSILTAGEVIELANDVSKTANDIRDLAFTWQSRGQGIPQIPSDFIMRSLSQQSSLVPSNVFTVGATRTSQCISRKTDIGYPHRQAVAMCLNMGRARRLGPRGGYRKVRP
jgi:hypothetical protein